MERVLIIEHNAPALRIMSAVLARSGVEHAVARDTAQAAEVIRQHRPDVIVFNTDMSAPMKELVMSALRALAPGVRILDVHTHPPRDPAEVPGADAFLHKPFRADELVDAVQGLLGSAGATPA